MSFHLWVRNSPLPARVGKPEKSLCTLIPSYKTETMLCPASMSTLLTVLSTDSSLCSLSARFVFSPVVENLLSHMAFI
jgi:hypothetical protein